MRNLATARRDSRGQRCVSFKRRACGVFSSVLERKEHVSYCSFRHGDRKRFRRRDLSVEVRCGLVSLIFAICLLRGRISLIEYCLSSSGILGRCNSALFPGTHLPQPVFSDSPLFSSQFSSPCTAKETQLMQHKTPTVPKGENKHSVKEKTFSYLGEPNILTLLPKALPTDV